jgi:hypothetical protein
MTRVARNLVGLCLAALGNISPSSIQIDATVSGMQLRTHAVTAVAGAIVETQIQPGSRRAREARRRRDLRGRAAVIG